MIISPFLQIEKKKLSIQSVVLLNFAESKTMATLYYKKCHLQNPSLQKQKEDHE